MNTSGVGAALRQERVKQGLSLHQIARKTRISERFLQAIELGNFDQLPGLLFSRNFVRQYALSLQLNPDPFLAELPKIDVDATPLPDPAAYTHTKSWSFATVRIPPALTTAVWLVLACGASVGAYLYLENPRLLSKVSVSQTSATAAISAEPARPAESAPTAVALSQPETPTSPPPAPTSAAPTPAAEAVPAAAKRAVEVVLTAKEATWVQIIADGKNAFTGILQANDSRTVDADALVKLTAGNAGGIEVSLNGKPLDPLGSAGQVRTVRLRADGPQPPGSAVLSPL